MSFLLNGGSGADAISRPLKTENWRTFLSSSSASCASSCFVHPFEQVWRNFEDGRCMVQRP